MLNILKIESLGARIIAINLIGLIFLGTGFLFVDKSQNNLIEARKGGTYTSSKSYCILFHP